MGLFYVIGGILGFAFGLGISMGLLPLPPYSLGLVFSIVGGAVGVSLVMAIVARLFMR